jgi:glycogen synthase kinase 3 beta
MHSLKISHRDLKPENILLKDGEVRICDVGSSKMIDFSEKRMNTPYVVSRYYRAPELILASNRYDFSNEYSAFLGLVVDPSVIKNAEVKENLNKFSKF